MYDPWTIAIGGAVISGLILYFVFGIGKEKKATPIHKSPFISARGNISAGRDIVIGSSNKSKKENNKSSYIYKNKKLIVTEAESKTLVISIPPTKIRKISSKISLIDSDNKKWRMGYVLIKKAVSNSYYAFHVFQDPGSQSFNSRIIEVESNKEIFPDILHTQLAVDNTKTFVITIENKNDNILFYVDDIPLGKCIVPLENISEIYIRGWSHKNVDPITMVVEYTRVWI